MTKLAAVPASAPPANDEPALEMPAHFKGAKMKRERAAWQDLVESAKPELRTKENRFTFEFAATLMAKFRGGMSMTATESKELKRLLVTLGLATNDDDQGAKRKPRKGHDYFA